MATTTDRERQEAREAEELAVGPLLARAKLLFMRKQWDEAISVCTDALRKYPASITAHSLLGDIYEAQGRVDDAIQWFAMAVERDPGSASDRAKLERLQKAQLLRQATEEHQKAAQKRVSARSAKAATEKTVEWFDRLFPPGRSESIARLIFIVCGILAALLIIGTVVVYLFVRRDRVGSALPAPAPTSGALAQPTEPVVVQPPAATVPAPAEPRRTADSRPGSPASPTAPSPSPTAATAPTATAAQGDVALRDGIARELTGAYVVSASRRDAATAQIEIGLLELGATEPPERLRERVLRTAAQAARAAFQAEGALQRVTVQASLETSGTAPSAPISAFRGEVDLSALRDLDPATADYTVLLSRFTSIEWASALIPSGSMNGAASGTPAAASPAAPPTSP